MSRPHSQITVPVATYLLVIRLAGIGVGGAGVSDAQLPGRGAGLHHAAIELAGLAAGACFVVCWLATFVELTRMLV